MISTLLFFLLKFYTIIKTYVLVWGVEMKENIPQELEDFINEKIIRSFHVSKPRVITVDKNLAYPIAVEELRKEKSIPSGMKLRQKNI